MTPGLGEEVDEERRPWWRRSEGQWHAVESRGGVQGEPREASEPAGGETWRAGDLRV